MYNTNTIPKLTKFRPIFQIFEINNSKTKTKLETLKAPKPIPKIYLGFWPKKGQYIVPKTIVPKIALVCSNQIMDAFV